MFWIENPLQVYQLQRAVHQAVQPRITSSVLEAKANVLCPETDEWGIWQSLFNGVYDADALPKIFLEHLAGRFDGMKKSIEKSE